MHSIISAVSRYRLWLLTLTILLLSACANPATPEPTPTTTSDFTRLATLTISADTSRAELASYGGEIVSFRPEAGFAILGFETMPDELSTLSTTANQNTFSVPAIAAGSLAWANGQSAWANGSNAWSNGFNAWANGQNAWANGFNAWSNGHSAWANGFNAWSNGANAWANGHSAWANGLPAASSVGDNLHAFDRINLAQGQLRAPKLGEGVVVAVIDTGIITDHPAFQGNLAPYDSWYDFIDEDSYPGERRGANNSAYGHGTAVAGLILQVAPAARIMPLRVLDADGTGDTADIVRAIEHAVLRGADVINISVGASQPDPAVHSMLKFAASRGVFVTASVGNEGSSKLTYPAYWGADADSSKVGNFLLSVASQDLTGKPSTFSNYGERSEIWAPGENLFSTYGNSSSGERRSAKVSGTSFANPLVAGTMALALAENPSVNHRSEFHFKLKEASQANGGSLDIDGYLQRLGLNAPTPARRALFVVGNERSPALIDAYLSRRLANLGFDVTLKDDDDITASDARGQDLLLISSSVYASKVGATFKHVDVPVIVWEQLLYDDMGLSTRRAGTVWSSGMNFTGNWIFGGLSGPATLVDSTQRIGYAYPTTSAQVIGKLLDYNVASTFVYYKGTTMHGLQAPAKRVGLFFNFADSTEASVLTSRAASLFDILVIWSVSAG